MTQNVSGRRELVSRAARRAFREIGASFVMRKIDGIWQDEGFSPGPANEETGARRSLYQQYLDAVDWADAAQVQRALRVLFQTLEGVDEPWRSNALRQLERDGYTFDASGNPLGGPTVTVRVGLLSDLPNAEVIREHLDRIERAISDQDPAQVIGSAKELIESTAKLILRERGEAVGRSDDIPDLVKNAQVALGVHPSAIVEGADGASASKKILGGLSSVVIGVAELRNRGYGTGHGLGESRVGLYPRHAHLAFSAAKTWCEFMLDTLGDPGAPWRRNG